MKKLGNHIPYIHGGPCVSKQIGASRALAPSKNPKKGPPLCDVFFWLRGWFTAKLKGPPRSDHHHVARVPQRHTHQPRVTLQPPAASEGLSQRRVQFATHLRRAAAQPLRLPPRNHPCNGYLPKFSGLTYREIEVCVYIYIYIYMVGPP